MNRYPLWKYLVILVAVLVSIIYTAPNFFGEVPAVQVSAARSGAVDTALMQRVEQALKTAQLPYEGVSTDPTGIRVRFKDTPTQIKARDVLQSALGAGHTVALNLLPATPQWLASLGAKPMYLGLDLRGGVHFLMQVDMKAAQAKAMESTANEVRTRLREERVRYRGIERQPDAVVVKITDAAGREKAEQILRTTFPDMLLSRRESAEGTDLELRLSEAGVKQIQDFSLQQNITTLRNRVNELGVAEPIVQQQGADRIVVQLPGVQDTAKAKEIIGRTATLEVRLVDEEKSNPDTLQAAVNGQVPFDAALFYDREGLPYLVKKEVILTGEYITNAAPGMDSQSGGAVVHVDFNGAGARIFRDVTRENVGRRMAILLVEKGSTQVVTAPVIREEIGGGRVQISGMGSLREATDVALLLRAGSLAAPMEIIEERTVGPSLGAENIERGFNSTLIGFALIMVFMVLYYRMFGVVAVAALAANMVFLVAILSILQATLTLPGIAGIALTLGMAIDSNVLIFERIREELRNGNSPQAAIHAGFDRAWGTILDANITTLIAGVALFWLGSGPIRGFAVTLCIGILTTLFSAVMVARAIVNLVYGRRRRLQKMAI